MKSIQWRLKSGEDRRFRSGHPWVYSNELQASPRGIEPGQKIELCDAQGRFLAWGYGNPNSLIAFREMGRKPGDELFDQGSDWLVQKLRASWQMRVDVIGSDSSFRWCFGEGDYLPGLIIDRWVTARGVVLSVQAGSAGVDRILDLVIEAAREIEPTCAAVVIRNDLGVRKLEGIEVQDPKLAEGSSLALEDLRKIGILVRPARGGLNSKPLQFDVDLIDGQKTGFFLDQSANIEQLVRLFPFEKHKKIRVLDLFCYVGQWGSQIAAAARLAGSECEVVAVDASETALAFAKANVERAGGKFVSKKIDILDQLAKSDLGPFDIVIVDPPALIKNRKHLPQGKHAYLTLNAESLQLLKSGGWFVTCSCSGLLQDSEWSELIARAWSREQKSRALRLQWVAHGGHAIDHPMRAGFTEGTYLKSLIGISQEEK
jgi:23S rRNA (cytosine1962-C5)-methyltransferase